MARTQTLVQLNDRLVALLDQQAGIEGRSRSQLIRDAIERYLSSTAEAEISRQIVEGYKRIPQGSGEDELGWDEDDDLELLREETW